MKNKLFSGWLLTLLALTIPGFAADTTRVQIKYGAELGTLRRPELFNNNSLLRPPSDAITQKYVKEIGTARIIRCWVTLDDFWNYTTNQYTYNFKCGWDLNKWDTFYDYMARFSTMSDELLLNVRGNHREVVDNKLTMAQWRIACKNGIKHYKQRYPKLKYIEALNEYEGSSFGGLTNDQYYRFYKEFYQIINEINSELKPSIPLSVGGPCIIEGNLATGRKKENMRAFLKNFADDKDPGKKLSFISYHEYGSGANPALVANHQKLIESWCNEFGLPASLPIFVDEMGPFVGNSKHGCIEDDILIQAAAMNSLAYFFNQQPHIQAFHWAMQHKTNERKNQIYDNHRWSPYGILLKMQARMAQTQIEADFPTLTDGKGIYCIAAKDTKKVTILVWNYQWTTGTGTHTVKLDLGALPASWQGKTLKINDYRLDAKTNNIHSGYGLFTKFGDDQLAITKASEQRLTGNATYVTTLMPNVISLVEIMLP